MTINIPLPSEWVDWVEENQALGVPEAAIGNILAVNGFDPRFASAPMLRGAATNVPAVIQGAPRLSKLETLMGI